MARAFTSGLNDAVPEYRARVLSTDGAVDSLLALRDGRAEFAIVTADTLAQAVNGEGAFEGRTVSARTIATLYVSRLYVIVPDDSQVAGFSQLRDRIVWVGPSGSGMDLTLTRALGAALLAGRVTTASHTWADLVSALDHRRVAAVAWLDGLPSPALTALRLERRKWRLVSSGSAVPLLQRRYGETMYEQAEVPAATYGSTEPSSTVGVAAVLVARHDLAEAAAFAVTRGLFRLSGALARACPAVAALTPTAAARPQPAALHVGAALFYRR